MSFQLNNQPYLLALMLVVLQFTVSALACTHADCNYLGVCNEAGECIYEHGYLKSGTGTYEQKHQSVAFLLQLFLGVFGAAEFYLGLITIAILKLALTIVALGIGFCFAFNYTSFRFIRVVTAIATFGVFVWWIIDCFRYGLNVVNDSNGIPLASW